MFGPIGLRVLVGVCVAISIPFVRRTLRRMGVTGSPQSMVLLLTLILSSGMWSTRPAMFSLPLLAITLNSLTEHTAAPTARKAWLLVPLVLLWANLHGVFVAGVVLIWCFTAGVLLTRRRRAIPTVGLAAAATLAGAVNPSGWAIYLHPLHVQRVSASISEWQPTTVRDPVGLLFVALLIATPLVLATRRRRPELGFVLAPPAFAYMGLAAEKNVWMAGVVMAPLVGMAVRDVLSDGSNVPASVGLSVVCCVLGGFGVLSTVAALDGQQSYDLLGEHVMPVAAVQRLGELPEGRVLNPYDWGGYILWKTPHVKVSIDGRNDMYGLAIFNEQDAVERLAPGWQDYLLRNDVQYAACRLPGTAGGRFTSSRRRMAYRLRGPTGRDIRAPRHS